MMLSASYLSQSAPHSNRTSMDKVGQISSFLLAKFLAVQRRCTFRRRGDANTRIRHLRHTRTSEEFVREDVDCRLAYVGLDNAE
ncbi:hypothetical protein BC826DRAFT_171895 [Russula brevipes]|nr:hypothetical protein BC826DRAFT_171895 [Russula brevipes]